MEKCRRIRKGHYSYRGYEIICRGYYEPEGCVYWEAINHKTNCSDFHAKTKGLIKILIDEGIKRDEEKANREICGNCDAFCECSLRMNGAQHNDKACEYFDNITLKQLEK